MKHLFKLLAWLLACALMLSGMSFALADELPVVTVLVRSDSAIPAEDAPVPMEIGKQTGIDLKCIFVSVAEYEGKLNGFIASGELPDIFLATNSLVTELVQYNAILDLRPLLEQYGPNVLADGEAKYSFGINKGGAIYALPRQMSYPWAMAVRRDWMHSLGYEVGDESVIEMDIETFKQLMVDFAQKDPDGDGVADIVAHDTTGDGQSDVVEMDTTGDGEIDTVYVDADGDGEYDVELTITEEEAEEEEDIEKKEE